MENIYKVIKANKEEAIRILQNSDGYISFDSALDVDAPWVLIDIGDDGIIDVEVEDARLNEEGNIELSCGISFDVTVDDALGFTANNVYEAIGEVYNKYLK